MMGQKGRRWLAAALAACLTVAWAGGPAMAQRWTWHLSGGIGLGGQQGTGAVLAGWGGVPSASQLFVRLGLHLGGHDATGEAGAAYFFPLGSLSPELAARYPALDPFVGAGLTVGNRTNAFAALGATYGLSERHWFWGELRVGGPHAVVLGLGLTL